MKPEAGVRADVATIVAAATRLFAVKGYRGTSMRDISAELGMHAGSLYVHIRDKGELLERVVERISNIHERDMREVLAMAAPAEAKLRELCRRQLSLLAEDRAATRVYFHEWRHLEDERQAGIVTARDAYETALRGILEQAVSEGDLPADLDRNISARALLGMLNWTYEWFRPDGHLDAAAVADAFVEIFLYGVARGSGSRSPRD